MEPSKESVTPEPQRSTSPSPGNGVPAAEASPERPTLVHVMIAVIAVLFVVMAALLYKQWLTQREPVALLVVQATEEFGRATVTLRGEQLTMESMERELNAENHFSCKFFLVPGGDYQVRVTKADGQVVVNQLLPPVPAYQIFTLPLGKSATTVPSGRSPATTPTAEK